MRVWAGPRGTDVQYAKPARVEAFTWPRRTLVPVRGLNLSRGRRPRQSEKQTEERKEGWLNKLE